MCTPQLPKILIPIVAAIFLAGIQLNAQNVAINSTGTAANTASVLDISSTSAGLLIPRVTAAQKTGLNPLPEAAQGLTVYQTDGTEGYYYNTSTTTTPSWVKLLGDEGWKLTGNAGTTPGTDFIGTTDAQAWVIKTNNAERARILSGGNFGIGTTAAAAKFHVANDEANAGVARIDNPNSAGFAGIYFYEAAEIHGWIGHVNSTSGFAEPETFQLGASGMDLVFSSSAEDAYLEHMRIDTGGWIGIGTVTPGYRLEVVDSFASDYAARFYNQGNNASRYGIAVQAGLNDGTGNIDFVDTYDGDGTYIGSLRSNSGTMVLFTTSDKRLKYDIKSTKQSGLSIVNSLRLVDYKWKKNNEQVQFGFIAQEVQEVYPEMVAPRKDGESLGIMPGKLVPVLVKAVQEQQALLDQYAKELKTLKKKVEQLSSTK